MKIKEVIKSLQTILDRGITDAVVVVITAEMVQSINQGSLRYDESDQLTPEEVQITMDSFPEAIELDELIRRGIDATLDERTL